MVKAVVFVLLASALALTAASSSNSVQWKPRPRVEYEFELSGRSLAGLPALQGQYSGVQYDGRVRIQGLTADTAIVKLERMEWSSLHGRLRSSWWTAEPEANGTLPGHNHMGRMAMPLSGAAAVARFQDGQVKSLLVSREARDWEVNLLQGVLGHMQVQGASGSDQPNGLRAKAHDQDTSSGAYRVLESGVSGRCLVQYEVSPANPPAEMSAAESKMCSGKPWVQITKTKNFTDCEQYAEQVRGLPRCSPAGNACASLWARNSLAQLIGCGSGADMQLVRAVSSSSMQAELQTREDSHASVFSSVNMTLTNVQAVRERIPTPKDGVVLQGLGYRVAGKQVSGNGALDSDYSSSSEEDDDDSNSVEVIGQPSRQHKQKEQDEDVSGKQKKSRKGEQPASAKKHQQDESASAKPKKQSHKKTKHSNGYDNSSNDSSSDSNNSNNESSNESSNSSNGSDNSNDSNNNSNSSSDDKHRKPKKGKHSRKPRSAKSNSHDEDDTVMSDAFAGTLAPSAVQKNSTLRAALQQRLAQEVNKAQNELNHAQGPSPRTMERLSMAVRLSRALNADQLSAVQNQIHDQDAKDLFNDVLALCGSEPCVQRVAYAIKQQKMSALSAQMVLSSLVERVSVPSRDILKSVQELYDSVKDDQVKIAAALAMGKLAARAGRPAADSAASFLSQQLGQQKDDSLLRAPLTYALGSTATSQAADALLQMAKDAKVSPYQRAQAILALRHCAARYASLIRDNLLALYHNPTEPAPVRMAAVSLLVYTKPSLPLWQRLAVSTFYEPNMAVSAYVWSTIQSFAKLQDPAFQHQTQFARLSLGLARRMPQGSHLAFNVVAASVDAQLDRLVHEQASYMGPADAANVYYRRVTRRAGVSTVDQELDLWGASPDDLMQAAMEAVFGPKNAAAARPVAKDVPHSTRSIHEKLNIARRRLQDPQGQLRLTLRPFFNNMFLTFDKNTPSHIAKAASQMMDKLHSETGFRSQMMGGEEISVATVTEMGFPVNLRIQAPWLVRAHGSAQVHRDHSAQANITCMYTAGLSAQLSVQPSWSDREYLAAVQGHALVQLPSTTFQAQMNATDGRMSVSVQPSKHQHEEAGHTVLARLASQPVTASIDLSRGELVTESATAHNASVAVPRGVDLSPWEGVSLNLRAPVEHAALPTWLRSSRTVLGFPVLGRPLAASRLELVASGRRAYNASFALVKAMMQSGDLLVVYPKSMRQQGSASTEMPMTSTTTEMPDTAAGPAMPRTPRGAEHGQHANGSLYMDDGDMDFSRSVFNATTLNPYDNRVNGSSELYVLSQVLAGMAAGRGYVLGVNVTAEDGMAQPARYSGFWSFGANLGGRLARAGFFARSDANKAQVAATGAVLRDLPARADVGAALQQLPAFMFKAEFQQVDASAVKKIVTSAMETDRSARKTARLDQAARELGCVSHSGHQHGENATLNRACRAILHAANSADQFNVTINYNHPAEEEWKSSVHSVLQAAKAYLWGQGNIAVDTLAGNNPNEIGLGITVLPDGKLDGWLQTPRTLTKVVAANAPVASSLLASASQDTGAYCGFSGRSLVTLDGAQGDLKLHDGCWHLLAKDCSGKSRVAVLAKADGPADVHVEINVDNYQIARLSPDGSATLNGLRVSNGSDQPGTAIQVRDAADVEVMTIVRSDDGALSVNMRDHGMNVVYGNNSVVIQADASLRGRLCGVCGNFNGSAFDDMVGPTFKAQKSIQTLVESYAIKEAGCEAGKKSRQ